MLSAGRSLSAFSTLILLCLLAGCGSSTPAPVAVTLSPSGNQAIDPAQTIMLTAAVTNDSKNAGVTWTSAGVGTLSNTTSTSATYTAPASIASRSLVSIVATSVIDPSKIASIQVVVNPTPVIATTALPAATITEAYSASIAVSGGTSPFTWTLASGSFPAGITLGTSTSNSISVSGTPTTLGSSSATIKVVDATGDSSTQTLALTVNPPGPLGITTASLPAGALTVAYNQTLAATGGITPYTWSIIAGNLPAGLTLNPTSGTIGGTPTATGTSTFTVQVKDNESPAQTTNASLSITINNAPLRLVTSSLPVAVVNVPYASTLVASGGTPAYSWSITSGSLPAGMTLNPSSGAITGTATATGTSSFTLTVTDSTQPTAQTASANLSIVVNPILTIATTSLPGGTVGTAYSQTLQASGGVPPYTWKLNTGSLPAGLALSTSGVISGTPTTTGTSSFSVAVSDSETPTEESVANFSIIINSASCPTNSNLIGSYALAMEGWNTDSNAVQSAAVASFVSDGNGHVTSGLLDTNDGLNGARNGTFTGTYCMSSNNLGTLTLNLSSPYSTTSTFAIALNSSGANGKVMYYDTSNTKAVGPLRKQDTSAFATSKITGNYAFGMIGTGAGAVGSRFGMAGQFNSTGAGDLSGMADADNSVSGASSQATIVATNLAVASNGSGTVSMSFSGGTTNFTLNFAFVVVNAGELLMLETDNLESGYPLLLGHVLQQSGTFTDSSISGNSVLGVQAFDNGGITPTAEVVGGILTTSGSGTITNFSFDENDGGSLSTLTGSGTYSVASNGRVTLTGLAATPPIFYLYGQNEGFVIGTDSAVSYGQFFPQTGSNFTKASLDGTYTGGSDHPQSANVGEEIVSVTANGSGSLTGTAEDNVNGGSPTQTSIADTYLTSASGRVVISQSGSQVVILYIVNANAVLAIPAGITNVDSNPFLEWLQQ